MLDSTAAAVTAVAAIAVVATAAAVHTEPPARAEVQVEAAVRPCRAAVRSRVPRLGLVAE